jgi:hypothetical protein
LFRVEGFAALIEGHLREVGAEPDLAGIGHQCAGEQVEQCRLASAVGATMPTRSPRMIRVFRSLAWFSCF